MLPTITIATDAGYSHLFRVGYWACRIRLPDDSIHTQTGMLKNDPGGSTQAERLAIANALWIVDRMVDLKQCRLVMYYDNISAMRKPQKPYGGKRRDVQLSQLAFYVDHIEKYLDKASEVKKQHIKAHTHVDHWTPENAEGHEMQRECDRECTRLLKKYKRGLLKVKQ